MAIQELSSAVLQLPTTQSFGDFGLPSAYVIDASGERAGLVFRAPRTGSIKRFEAWVSAVGNAPDNGLRFSFQDVSVTTGQPDGTVDQFATVASGSVVAGWLNPGNFDAQRTVTRGDYLAAVLDFPTFVTGDSVSIGVINSIPPSQLPYGLSATTNKELSGNPSIILVYDNGSGGDVYVPVDRVVPINSSTITTNFSQSSSPDEYGNVLQFPFPVRVVGAHVWVGFSGSDCDAEINLYNASNTALATATIEGSVNVSGFGAGGLYVPFSSDVDLSANTLYRLAMRSTNANGINIGRYSFASANVMQAWVPGGSAIYGTARTDSGSWTNYNNTTDGFRLYNIALIVRGFEAGGSGGGAAQLVGGGLTR